MTLLAGFIILLVFLWVFERFYLRGGNPDQYEPPTSPDSVSIFETPENPGPQHKAVNHTVSDITAQISQAMREHNLPAARAVMDSLNDGRTYVSQFTAVDAGGTAAEWVLAPGADSQRRMLYIHGGGFIMGSPKSHRTITSKFSEITGCAVLALDYRLMPEHRRMDGVEDCRKAYRWILENGPDGPGPLSQLFVGGDSGGGNLSLSLAAWVRDNNLRVPDAVVALSPMTDSTFSAASIRNNESTDIMLSPMMRVLNRLSPFLKSWWALWVYRTRPANPVISPLLGDLSGLPPTLVQASESEMLLDDARRYVYKACASGSPAKLQTWTNSVHVWQIFEPHLPQAAEAWDEIKKFLDSFQADKPRNK
jgi:acetyl esterase/lipase